VILARILWNDWKKSPMQAGLKIILPTFVVGASGLTGRAALVLAVLIPFVGIMAPAIGIVRMKISGMYRRLVTSAVSKPFLITEYTGVFCAISLVQLAPSLALVAFFEGIPSAGWGIVSVLFVVILGVLLGMATEQLGTVHMGALGVTIPLLAVTLFPTAFSSAIPLAHLNHQAGGVLSLILPFMVISILYGMLVAYAARL